MPDLIKWIKPFRFYSEEGDVISRNLLHRGMTRAFLQEMRRTPGDGGTCPIGNQGKRQRGERALVCGSPGHTTGPPREAGEQIKYDAGAGLWRLSGTESACQLQETRV